MNWTILDPGPESSVNTSERTQFEIIKTATTFTAIINGTRGNDVTIDNGDLSRIDLELDPRNGQTRVEVRKLELRDIGQASSPPSSKSSP